MQTARAQKHLLSACKSTISHDSVQLHEDTAHGSKATRPEGQAASYKEV